MCKFALQYNPNNMLYAAMSAIYLLCFNLSIFHCFDLISKTNMYWKTRLIYHFKWWNMFILVLFYWFQQYQILSSPNMVKNMKDFTFEMSYMWRKNLSFLFINTQCKTVSRLLNVFKLFFLFQRKLYTCFAFPFWYWWLSLLDGSLSSFWKLISVFVSCFQLCWRIKKLLAYSYICYIKHQLKRT